MICESFARSIRDDFCVDVIAHKVMLTHEQVTRWKLPPNMDAKTGSTNYQKFRQRYGSKAYELESLTPDRMQSELSRGIETVVELSAFNAELEAEKHDAARLAAAQGNRHGGADRTSTSTKNQTCLSLTKGTTNDRPSTLLRRRGNLGYRGSS